MINLRKMISLIFFGFLIISIDCDLTRHSDDVLKRERIFIEAHRGLIDNKKNENTKEAILDAMANGVEAFETDVWLTKDKKIILSHGGTIEIDSGIFAPFEYLNWSDIQEISKFKENKIPLLEDIMNITKGKIFMNLEIKDKNDEIWEIIQELIEKYEYYDQISISAYNESYYPKVVDYNKKYNRKIVFGFLKVDLLFNKNEIIYRLNVTNHQISLNANAIKDNQDFVKDAHKNGMTVGVYFFVEPKDTRYYELFEIGVDVIITNYPIKVANQLNEYNKNKSYLEGCESIIKRNNDLSSCLRCKSGYGSVYIKDQSRYVCKLKYEIDPDLFIRDSIGAYKEKKIFAIKMLYDPIYNQTICQKNGNRIFYFEWLFDLYGYDYGEYVSSYMHELYHCYEKKYILSNLLDYSQLNEKHIKKLNFSRIEIYVDKKLINSSDFLCIDLYDTDYFTTYRVMGAHCYFIYNGEEQSSYKVEFRLFDDNYVSFVTYDNNFLSNYGSWRKSETKYFYFGSESECNAIKDPFQERISCIDKISNCMYCENENECKKCNYGFALFNGQCYPSIDYQDDLKYFSPDNGTNYYHCSSFISNCEECSYDEFAYNHFYCLKCSNGLYLNETFECDTNPPNTENESIDSIETKLESDGSENSSRIFIGSFIYLPLILLIII